METGTEVTCESAQRSEGGTSRRLGRLRARARKQTKTLSGGGSATRFNTRQQVRFASDSRGGMAAALGVHTGAREWERQERTYERNKHGIGEGLGEHGGGKQHEQGGNT